MTNIQIWTVMATPSYTEGCKAPSRANGTLTSTVLRGSSKRDQEGNEGCCKSQITKQGRRSPPLPFTTTSIHCFPDLTILIRHSYIMNPVYQLCKSMAGIWGVEVEINRALPKGTRNVLRSHTLEIRNTYARGYALRHHGNLRLLGTPLSSKRKAVVANRMAHPDQNTTRL